MKKIMKVAIVIILLSLAQFPIVYAITSPDYLAWWFYAVMTGMFGGSALFIGIFTWNFIDNI